MRKYSEYFESPDVTGMRIDLNANFRSRKEVLNATNYVLHKLWVSVSVRFRMMTMRH